MFVFQSLFLVSVSIDAEVEVGGFDSKKNEGGPRHGPRVSTGMLSNAAKQHRIILSLDSLFESGSLKGV